ncbi:MAG: hypothetical protein WCK02_11080 [Bacteroidota bacterium]
MKLFRITYLLLSSLVFFYACSPIHGFHKADKNKQNNTLSINSAIDSSVKTSVYKAQINIYKKYFSGLFLVKYIPKDSSYHIVFLSEVGLNLLDLEYKNNNMNVISCQDFLNKKAILNTIKNDFLLLFLEQNQNRKIILYENNNNDEQVLKYSYKWRKFYYFCKNQNEIYRIYRKHFLFGSVNVLITKNQDKIIDEINFKHKGIKLNMNLVRLNKGE